MPILQKIRRPSSPKDFIKSKDKFYHFPSWRRLTKLKRTLNPFCEYCQDKGFIKDATLSDHYYTRALWPELSMEIKCLRSSCDGCHQRKRVIERQFNNKGLLLIKLKENGFQPPKEVMI
jgi:hypothetical protein